jgi:probable rRNA maturation factor
LNTIKFNSEIVDYQINNSNKIRNWLRVVASSEKINSLKIQYFFVDERKILEINNKHLKHNYITDIITFNYSFLKVVSGDIYICIPSVKDNSKIYSENNIDSELLRIILHGLLHLLGYNDITEDDKKIMTKKENYYLKYFDEI